MSAVIRAVADQASSDVVSFLESLLAEARDGEIVGVTAVIEFRGGTYRIDGPAVLSRLQSAGALLEAAVKRLDI